MIKQLLALRDKYLPALFILLFISLSAKSQVKQNYPQYGGKWKRIQVDSAIKIPMVSVGIKDYNNGTDTAQIRYNAADSSVEVYTGNGWIKAVRNTGGSTNSNIGSGYRLAVPGTNNIKTLFAGYGILKDSTSNANGITTKVDTATVFPAVRATIPATTSLPISSLTAATGTNTIDNGNNSQTWNWNSLAGTHGLRLQSTSTAATGNAQVVLSVAQSGANSNSDQSTECVRIANSKTGTNSTNIGISSSATGGTTNIAGYFNASGGTNNYAIQAAGRVGINTGSPTAWLDVQDADGAIATGVFNAHEDRTGEIVNIQQSGVKRFSFNTTGAIDIIEESSAPTTPASGYVSIYANSGNSKLYTKNDAAKEAQLIQDLQLVFGAGSGADSDTTAFTTSAIYGSFYNDADTIVVTSMRGVLQGTSPDVTYKVWYNDSLNVEAGATALVTAGSQVTNTTTGTNVTSFAVTKIPPGNWVWVKTSTVATKPKYFSLTINGYRK